MKEYVEAKDRAELDEKIKADRLLNKNKDRMTVELIFK